MFIEHLLYTEHFSAAKETVENKMDNDLAFAERAF